MVRLILKFLRGHALLGHVEHRRFDPDLRGLLDADELQVLQHPGDAAVFSPECDLDVGESGQVRKCGHDRESVRGIHVIEATHREQIVARVVPEHPSTRFVTIQETSVQRLPVDRHHVQGI